MADQPTNPPASPAGAPSKPPGGATNGLAARVGAAHGASKPAPPPQPAAPGLSARPKGGRRPFAEDLAEYLRSTGQTLVPVQATTGAPVGPVQPVGHVVSPEFIGDFVETVLTVWGEHRVQSTTRRVKMLCGDDKLAREYGETAGVSKALIESTSKGSVEVAKKYPSFLQWAPEVTVAAGLGLILKNDLETQKRLDVLEKRVIEARKPKPSAPATVPSADAPATVPSS